MNRIDSIQDIIIEYEMGERNLNIKVTGRIDAMNAMRIQMIMEWELVGKSFVSVVIDGEGLEYISSAGLRWLLSLKKNTKAIDMSVINLNPVVENIFYVTGFDNVFRINR